MTQNVPMFDPFTGEPLKPLYDSFTGQPLAGVSTVQAEDAVTVHPTANGGLHDGATGALAERLQALEDRVTELESIAYEATRPEVKPDRTASIGAGTADTSSIRATGGVNGGDPAELSLLDSASVPTNNPTAPELPIPAGNPSFTDERNETPISTTGPAFEPENPESATP